MYVVTVTFRTGAEDAPRFLDLVRQQARNSLEREPACRQFDVCTDPEDPTMVFLYEIYDDAAAFELHLASDHFRNFDKAVADMVTSKEVRILNRVA